MDVKQDPLDILDGFTIKTEPANVLDPTEQRKYCYPEDTVSGNSQMFPKTIKQEFVNIGAFKETYIRDIKQEVVHIDNVKETYISDIKQEVDEYIHQKTESELSELLTSHCDLPTLKTESTSDLGYQGSSKSLENTAKCILKKKMRYTCPICQNNYSSSSSRSTHIDRHFEKRYAVCQFCGKLLNKNEIFQHFFFNHLVKNRIKNHIDGKPLKELQQKSINNIDDKLFKSGTSFKTFNDKSNPSKCGICSKCLKYKKPLKCDICGKCFKSKSSLQRHIKLIHVVETPLKCEICSKSFEFKWSLRDHLIIHRGGNLIKCVLCSKGFNNKSNLQRHIKLIHLSQKPFECGICSKKFSLKYVLQRHLLTHSGEKPFKCDICSKSFNDKSNLRQHLLTHSKQPRRKRERKKSGSRGNFIQQGVNIILPNCTSSMVLFVTNPL